MSTAAASGNAGQVVLGLLAWAALIAAYWAPTIIAWLRHVPNIGSVAVIDGLLGWTIVGWIVALALACRSVPPGLSARPASDGQVRGTD